jgi:hypothetical protein
VQEAEEEDQACCLPKAGAQEIRAEGEVEEEGQKQVEEEAMTKTPR